jgi:oligogalacturonide lyase
MPQGQVWKAEWSTERDRTTGFEVRRLTNCPPSSNRHFYFHQVSWTPDSSRLIFTSDRAGAGELFSVNLTTGEIVQLTGEGRFGEATMSIHSPTAYYSAGEEFRAVNLLTLEDRAIAKLPDGIRCYSGPSENADGSLLVFVFSRGGSKGLAKTDITSGLTTVLWETAGTPSHVNCSLRDPEWIMHCDSTVSDAEPKQRVWVLSTDGERHWHPYTQTPQEWLTHESWLGMTGKLLICYWPTGIMEINIDGSESRLIAAINAWHAGATRDGRFCVVDTNWPDRGIHLIERETGRMCKVCEADSGTGDVNAGSEVHPHPSFSPDGKYIQFGSQRTGKPEVYVVETDQVIARQDLWWKPQSQWHRW